MAEMNELFYRDPYVRTFEATVTACEEGPKGFEVELDDTAFYPEGGGQLADHGKIGCAVVNDTRRVGGRIIHFCDKPVNVGEKVVCELDWERRYDNMQNHSGEHIFSGLVHKKFGFDNVGFHMDDDLITCDFSGVMTKEEVAGIEREANEAVAANIPVGVLFPSAEELHDMNYRSKKELSGKVRIVDVPGCDRCACCGTHVKTSGEIGMIKVLSSMKHRGGTRVEFVCGLRAIRDYERRIGEVQKVSALLSSKPFEIGAAVEKTLADLALRDQKIVELTKKIFEIKSQFMPTGAKVVVLFEEGLTPLELRSYATLLSEKGKGKVVAVLSATAPDTWSYVIVGPADLMRDASRELNKKLCGRGGGSSGTVQGAYKADAETIRAAIEDQFAAL